jgi:LPXTG-motif cell wall-anchored protein
MKFVGMMLLLMGAAAVAVAGIAPTPEIDANSSVSALLLLSGGLLMLRSRRKK